MMYQGFYSAIAMITPNTQYEDQAEGSNNTALVYIHLSKEFIKLERNLTLNYNNCLKSGIRDCEDYL